MFTLSCEQSGGLVSSGDIAAALVGGDSQTAFKFRESAFFGKLRGAPRYELLDIVETMISKGLLERSGAGGSLCMSPSGLSRLKELGMDTLGASARTPDAARLKNARQRALADADRQALEGLCVEQLHVMKAVVNDQHSVFFTGAAGTGKTYTLRRLISLLKSKGMQVAVTASTGVAACALGGSTIHSWSGMGRATEGVEALAARANSSRSTKQRWQNAQVLVLDEVSMIDAEFMDKLDVVARRCRGCSRLPFGGMQMVFVGDFCQLPPVSSRGGGPLRFAFQSAAWRGAVRTSIVLKQVYRQATDLPFIQLLSRLRFGQVDSSAVQQLQAAKRNTKQSGQASMRELTRLSAKNAAVDALNEQKLKELPGDGCSFVASPRLPSNPFALPRAKKLLAQLEAGCPARPELHLRVGAAVMLLHNLDVLAGLTNGTRGTVVGFDFKQHHSLSFRRKVIGHSYSAPDASGRGGGTAGAGAEGPLPPPDTAAGPSSGSDSRAPPLPIVQFSTIVGGQHRVLDPLSVQLHDFEVQEDAQHWAALRQVPLALAWSVTIHKSQGMTLHNVHIDCNGIFETGQTYVALSRASALSGMTLTGFSSEHVRANPVALAFHASIGDGPHVATAATPSPARPRSDSAAAHTASPGQTADGTVRALAFSPMANSSTSRSLQHKRARSPQSAVPPGSATYTAAVATPGDAAGSAAGAVPGSAPVGKAKPSAGNRLRDLLRERRAAQTKVPRRGGW